MGNVFKRINSNILNYQYIRIHIWAKELNAYIIFFIDKSNTFEKYDECFECIIENLITPRRTLIIKIVS